MTDQVTRCPNCDTSFVVTEAQLAAADGAVRCGACLHVFMARDYFVEAPIADLFEASEVETEPDEEQTQQSSEHSSKEVHLSEEQEISEATFDDPVILEDFEEETESQAENLESESLETENLETESIETESSETESSEIESLDTARHEVESVETDNNDISRFEGADEASDVVELDVNKSVKSEDALLGELSDAPQFGAELDQALDQIEQEASDLVPEFEEQPVTHRFRWFLASVLFGTVLVAQHLWFEKDEYAAQAQYRTYYEKFCNAAGCELKAFSDMSKLTTQNLMVRTHPTIEQGLVVDALLRNEARYRQAFPGLYLRFADIRGDTIADRTFSPNTYLAGEMAGLKYIPAATEVRLSLEIVDPGSVAVSYSLVAVAGR